MKKLTLLFIIFFSLNIANVFGDVFIKDLNSLKIIKFQGNGKAGKSSVPAIKEQEAMDIAKKEAQKQIVYYLEKIKTSKGNTLEELSQNNTSLQILFAETLKESKIITREWETENNYLVEIQVDLVKIKEKLDKLGVE